MSEACDVKIVSMRGHEDEAGFRAEFAALFAKEPNLEEERKSKGKQLTISSMFKKQDKPDV